MIDNAMASRCRCPRCLKLFREYLKKQYPPELLGLPDFDYVRFPSEAALFKETNAEVKDLLMQAAFDFWAESNHAALKKICDHVHDNYPGFLVSGNASSPRRTEGFRCYGMAPGIYRDCFDIVLCQNGNDPHLSGNSLINRIRELMFFAADKIPVNPLSDGDAGNGFSSPALLLAQMLECRVWGGITGDRLVMVPDRGEHLNRKRRQERDPVNQHFMRISAAFRHVFEAEEASIIGCLYSEHAHKWSRSSQLSLLVWEEMLLRIKALLRRARIVSERRIVIGDVVLDYDAMTVSRGSETQQLPQKEFLLLYKLLSYPGKIFTRIQLMDEIWGMDSETGWETVTVHIGRLRKRFEGWPEFEILSVRGLGYKAVKKV